MVSGRDTHSNLSGRVVLLMSELVISNKNLVEAPKEKNPPGAGPLTVPSERKYSRRRQRNREGRHLPTEKRGPLLLVMRI